MKKLIKNILCLMIFVIAISSFLNAQYPAFDTDENNRPISPLFTYNPNTELYNPLYLVSDSFGRLTVASTQSGDWYVKNGTITAQQNGNWEVSIIDAISGISAELDALGQLKVVQSSVTALNPLPVDGDRVYTKDLDISRCDITGWTGSVSDLFGDLYTGITNMSSDNPKVSTITFNQTIPTTALVLTAKTGSFSNVKIIGLYTNGLEQELYDGSADSTVLNYFPLQHLVSGYNGLRLEFHTTNAVTLTDVLITKSRSNVSRLAALKPDGTVTDIKATANGNLDVSIGNVVDTNNSTTTILGAGQTFTGTATEMLDYQMISVLVKSDVDSATDGLTFCISPDGTNWDSCDSYTITGGSGRLYCPQVGGKYFRVTYTNGSTPQSYFRLHTMLHRSNLTTTSHRIDEAITGENDAQLGKSVITGKTPSGIFVNVETTDDGHLKIADYIGGMAETGYVFEASHRYLAVPDDGYAVMFFALGSTKTAQVLFDIASEGLAYVDGWAYVNVTSSGTLFTTSTKNFIENKTNIHHAYYEPVVVSSGTKVFEDIIFGGVGNKTVGATSSEPIRWICDAGGYFMLTLQNKGGDNKDILIRVFWTEEDLN